jgi:hypothetical protein
VHEADCQEKFLVLIYCRRRSVDRLPWDTEHHLQADLSSIASCCVSSPAQQGEGRQANGPPTKNALIAKLAGAVDLPGDPARRDAAGAAAH